MTTIIVLFNKNHEYFSPTNYKEQDVTICRASTSLAHFEMLSSVSLPLNAKLRILWFIQWVVIWGRHQYSTIPTVLRCIYYKEIIGSSHWVLTLNLDFIADKVYSYWHRPRRIYRRRSQHVFILTLPFWNLIRGHLNW